MICTKKQKKATYFVSIISMSIIFQDHKYTLLTLFRVQKDNARQIKKDNQALNIPPD